MSDTPKSLPTSNTVPLNDEAAVKKILEETVLGLWDVVNNLTRLRPSKHENYRVTIFGSARAKADSSIYDEVRRLATSLADLDCDIITGGGPGLMQAANEGAATSKLFENDRSVGIRVHLPFEQSVNPFVQQAYEHKTFFTRLHHFVIASDAFVVVPGGIGTVLELMMVWQLLQVQHVYHTPLILVGKMWAELVAWARIHFLRSELMLANPEDLQIPVCVDTVDEAIEVLRIKHSE
jgi:uncharacterized protein (TIGR00730 family)